MRTLGVSVEHPLPVEQAIGGRVGIFVELGQVPRGGGYDERQAARRLG